MDPELPLARGSLFAPRLFESRISELTLMGLVDNVNILTCSLV
jgi:hypothetical protein